MFVFHLPTRRCACALFCLGIWSATLQSAFAVMTRDANVAPVSIASCRPAREEPLHRYPGRLFDIVSFSVTDQRIADLVRFTVIMPDGQIHTSTARGRFAPYIPIENRHLSLDPETASPSFTRKHRSTCSVTYVLFEDGTAWAAPV
jgi:hypothetical protein